MRKVLTLACLKDFVVAGPMLACLLMFSSWMMLAVPAWAQEEVATVSSSAPFTMHGARVIPSQGVPMRPVLAGHSVKAGDAPAIFTFPDGSVLMLDAGSEAKIDLVNQKPVFQLLGGTARYSLRSTSAVQLMASHQAVTPSAVTGTLSSGPGGRRQNLPR